MNSLRINLAQLMAAVLSIGFGFAALRNADQFWASATYTLSLVMIAAALVGAVLRRGGSRSTWTGFAVFGWSYLLVVQLPPWHSVGLGFGPIERPVPLIEWAMARLQPSLHPRAPGGGDLVPYEQVTRSLGILFFGLVGAILGRLLGMKDGRPKP